MRMKESGEIKESERNKMIKQGGPRALDPTPESLSGGEDVYHKIQIPFSNKSILGITQIIPKNLSGH